MAVGTRAGTIQIFDVERQHRLRTIREHTQQITSLDWSTTSPSHLVSGSSDCCIVNHDLRVKDSAINVLGSHNGQITNLKLN